VKDGVQNLFPSLWEHHASSFNDCFGFRACKIPLFSKWDFIRHKEWKQPWNNNIFKWYDLQAFFSFKHRTYMLVSSHGCTWSIVNSLRIWTCYNGLSNVHKMSGGCFLRSCRTHRVNWGSLKRRMKEGNNKFIGKKTINFQICQNLIIKMCSFSITNPSVDKTYLHNGKIFWSTWRPRIFLLASCLIFYLFNPLHYSMYSTQCDIWKKFKKSINEIFIIGKLCNIIWNL